MSRMPGPGQYDYSHLYGTGRKGPFVGIKLKRDQQHDNSSELLGPGTYNIRTDLTESPGIKFPKAKREALGGIFSDRKNKVGPGHYDILPTFPQIQPHEARQKRQNTEYY